MRRTGKPVDRQGCIIIRRSTLDDVQLGAAQTLRRWTTHDAGRAFDCVCRRCGRAWIEVCAASLAVIATQHLGRGVR